jgi:phage shock protein PspC (stress-responsive transcriptional regulator)
VNKTIVINLTGHETPYRVDEAGYERLATYLERAAHRLRDDPDRAEVLGDLERSIGDRLSAAVGTDDRLVGVADIVAILEAIGTVDTGTDDPVEEEGPRPRRRLQRIREGQQLAGVCNGLAAYAELDVAWVRTGFVLGTLATAGLFGLVYVALAFILPIAPRHEVRL